MCELNFVNKVVKYNKTVRSIIIIFHCFTFEMCRKILPHTDILEAQK